MIALLPAVPGAVRFVTAPVWGRLADRLGRQRPLLLIGLAAYMATMLLLPRAGAPLDAVALIAASSVFSSAFNPVARLWLTLRDPGRALGCLARWQQAEAAGFLLASALLGWTVDGDFAGLKTWMWMAAGAFAVCLAWVGRAVPDVPVRATGGWRAWEREPDAAEGRRVGRDGDARRAAAAGGRSPAAVLAFVLVASLTWEAVGATYGVYVTQVLGVPAKVYGLTVSASTVVSLWAYGPLAAAARRRGGDRLFLWSAAGYCAMYLLMASRSPWAVSLAYLIPMSAVLRTATNAWLTLRVPDTVRGRASGLLDATEACAAAVGALLGGVAAHHLGLAFVPRAALAGSLPLFLILAGPRGRARREV